MSGERRAPGNKRAVIFESYGWKDAGAVAKALHRDLEQAGYDVWIDVEEIKPGEPFPPALVDAIARADMVLALLSPHSVRLQGDAGNVEGSSVVNNELLEAHGKRKPIVPVMVMQCSTPFVLNILRKIDFTRWSESEEAYRQGLSQVLESIERALSGEAQYVVHFDRIRPLDMTAELVHRYRDFIGREWLFARVEDWLAGDRACLLIEGESGTGKSAFAAELIRRNPNDRVLAYHFCLASRPRHIRAGDFVRSIAAIIGGQETQYGERIMTDEAVREALAEENCRSDPVSALITGVLVPLHDLAPAAARCIVVDALDEALSPQVDMGLSIPALLRATLPSFPPWLRVLMTTRSDARIVPLFQAAEFIRLATDQARQDADVSAFATARFAEPALAGLAVSDAARTRAISSIVARSGGNFRYAEEVVRALAAGEFGLEAVARLPRELAGLYYASFQRRFPGPADFRTAEICLAVLLAAHEPLSEEQLVAITGLDRRSELQPALIALTGYVTAAGGEAGAGFVLFHTSMADWLKQPAPGADQFRVDPQPGLARLVAFCRAWRENDDPYALRHLVVHLIEAELVAEALAAVRSGFFAARTATLGETRIDLEDARLLTKALLRLGDAAGIVALAETEGSWQRDGVAVGLMTADAAEDALVAQIIAMLLRRKPATRGAPSAAFVNARYVAIRAAEAKGLAELLVLASRDRSPTVRVLLIPLLYRFWNTRGEAGWELVQQLAADLSNRIGVPNGEAIETFGHLSLAILNRHRDDAATMARLLLLWRRAVNRMLGGPLARVSGRGWLMRLLARPLAWLLARQPDYQPLNAREVAVTFSRPPAFRTRWEAALGCIEHPGRGIEPVAAILADPALPFDLYLMLCCERALILHAVHDLDGSFALCDRLFREGCAWFRQSALYALFHILTRAAAVADAQLERYAEMTGEFFASTGATMTTSVAEYSFAPHLCWPEIVAAQHRPGRGPWLLPGLLATALQSGSPALLARAFKAVDILCFAYGHTVLAAASLQQAYALGGARVEAHIIQSLANLRFQDAGLADELLARREFVPLGPQVLAMPPSIEARDIPTWVDGFVIDLLLTSDAFRSEVCGAFRRALTARSRPAFLVQILRWVVAMISGQISMAGTPPRP